MGPSLSNSPTFGEAMRFAIENALYDVNTAIVGRVMRYDAEHQLADVLPLMSRAYEDEIGERTVERLPVVPNCPVQFSGGAGVGISHPVAVGDTGLLVFSQQSMDAWLAGSGGEQVDPGIDHRHNITDGVFIPGVRARGAARRTNPGSAVCAGKDGGTYQGAGLGADIRAMLLQIITAINGIAPGSITPPVDPHAYESQTFKITP